MTSAVAPGPFAGWELYPSNLPADESLGFDVNEYSKRLTERSESLFSDDIEVRVIDVNDTTNPSSTIQLIQDAPSLETTLCQTTGSHARVISISQYHSLSPFPISEELMRKTLTRYAVPPRFLDVLFGVSGNTKYSEEGYGAAVFSMAGESSGLCDISYQFKFVEKNDHKHGSPWSFRQMEIFHRVLNPGSSSSGVAENFWLVLHPTQNSKSESSIETVCSSEHASDITSKPMRVHLQLISAHIDNWRAYLDYEGQIYQEQRKLMLTTDFDDDVDFNASMNFDAMLSLRSLQDRLLSVPVILERTISTIDELEKMNEELLLKMVIDEAERNLVCGALRGLRSRIKAHVASASMLQKRVQGVENLLADGLSMRNQVIAATNQQLAAQNQRVATGISKNLLNLTMESVDDSKYVQLVSLASFIYLPATFVASLFGTNFFAFGASAELRLASNIWIYVVVTIPLTIFTIGCWWLASRDSRKQRQDRGRREKEAA